MIKFFGKIWNNKQQRPAFILVLSVAVFFVLNAFWSMDHLSVAKFDLFYLTDHFDRYTDFSDYKYMSHYTGRVLEGYVLGDAYLICKGEDAQRAFEFTIPVNQRFEIKKAALAKSHKGWGVPNKDYSVYMFVFKKRSEAAEFYEKYTEHCMSRYKEQGKGLGYFYTVCYEENIMGCYLENDTVLILYGHPGRLYFDKLCRQFGIKSPYDPAKNGFSWKRRKK